MTPKANEHMLDTTEHLFVRGVHKSHNEVYYPSGLVPFQHLAFRRQTAGVLPTFRTKARVRWL
jgi:hypothetical protein